MRLIATFFGAALLLLAAVSPTNMGPVERRIQELLPWVAQESGYSTANVRPTVFYKNSKSLNKLYYGPGIPENSEDVLGITIRDSIFLLDTFVLGTEDHILVHELVHVLQYTNKRAVGIGPYMFSCIGESEKEAYEITNRWVEETGIGHKIDAFFIFFISKCPSEYGNM